jgi:hypothetical protein
MHVLFVAYDISDNGDGVTNDVVANLIGKQHLPKAIVDVVEPDEIARAINAAVENKRPYELIIDSCMDYQIHTRVLDHLDAIPAARGIRYEWLHDYGQLEQVLYRIEDDEEAVKPNFKAIEADLKENGHVYLRRQHKSSQVN